jgi:hypothetical protein
MTKYGRPIAYDREIFIGICRRLIIGEELQKICSEHGMPIGPVFLGWVQDHQEAREIYRSAENFHSDRRLVKEVDVCLPVSVSEWEEQVRANLERGWRADWIDRKYIPPDWSKVYPLIGGPPVGSTEMQAYNVLLNAFTQMLEPRDEMELIWTKEATDATWEAGREAREKNGLTSVTQPANALDQGRPLEAGFKYDRALDVAQSRAIKRRDNALRQIERWRKGLGAKARRLPDHLLVEHLLAQRYGVEQFLADAEADASAGDALEAGAPLAPTGKAAEDAPPHATTGEVAVAAAPSLATAGEVAEPAPALASTGNAAEPAPLIAATGDIAAVAAPAFAGASAAAAAPPPLAPTGELQQPNPHVPLRPRLARAAPPDAPPVRAPSEAAEQHHARVVRFLAEPAKSVAVNANRRL